MNLFLTGFPGFIAARLVPKLVKTRSFDRVLLLVESRLADEARRVAGEHLSNTPTDIVVGDITKEKMGITDESAWGRLQAEETEWWHLAALYRLNAEREPCKRINVDGTRNVLTAAKSCAKVHRLNYVSTAYVSGRTTGLVREDDLPKPDPENFKNHYEATKNEAEWLVRESMDVLPTTIYRFGVVAGDSRTGQIAKFDGPFFVIKYFDRMRLFPLLRVGPMEARLNIVPVDYIVDASCAISGKPETVGKCFQLVDPDPITTGELYSAVARALGRREPKLRVPQWVMSFLMSLRIMRKLYGLPKQATEYINHVVEYDCANTLEALEGTGITCPRVDAYVPAMVSFYLANKHLKELHLPVD